VRRRKFLKSIGATTAAVAGTTSVPARSFFNLGMLQRSSRSGGYVIEHAAFFDGTSGYLTRTFSSITDQKTWTFSVWVKRSRIIGALGGSNYTQYIFGSGGNTYGDGITFRYDALLKHVFDGEVAGVLESPGYYRDSSGWYHILVVCDTTQASSQIRTYVNGSEVIFTGTQPAQNYLTAFNTNTEHVIGVLKRGSANSYAIDTNYLFDGYMADVIFVDGQGLLPTNFGEFDSQTGEWGPKKFAGTYGTNGFHLDFSNTGNLGEDKSGNGNNWTVNGGVSQSVSTPGISVFGDSSCFCQWSHVIPFSQNGISEGGTRSSWPGSGNTFSVGNFVVNSGKWYFEGVPSASGGIALGVVPFRDGDAQISGFSYYQANLAWQYVEGASQGQHTVYGTSDVVAVALDCDSKTIQWYLNGSAVGSTYTLTQFPVAPLAYTNNVGGYYLQANFGARDLPGTTYSADAGGYFYHNPPANFKAMSTANLSESQVKRPSEHFGVALYTGNGTSQSVTGLDFQPDLVWIKNRTSSGTNPRIFDSLRGVTNRLLTDGTGVESSDPNGLTSFSSNGFVVGADNGSNESGSSIVAWCWKAGGASVANNDGTVVSQVSANTEAGFSIVSWSSSKNERIGHGLAAAPETILMKSRNVSDNWYWYTPLVDGSNDFLLLNETSAKADSGFGGPTSTDFGSRSASANYIAYCWHSVDGYSKFGSYTGNGDVDGPFVYLGFRPAFFMWKRTDTTGNWNILDSFRDSNNPGLKTLQPNLSDSEFTIETIDLLSNGVKIKNTWADLNALGGSYVYAAFAEVPLKYARAR
jgi:hypothetical protein